eukprot:Em0018g740a
MSQLVALFSCFVIEFDLLAESSVGIGYAKTPKSWGQEKRFEVFPASLKRTVYMSTLLASSKGCLEVWSALVYVGPMKDQGDRSGSNHVTNHVRNLSHHCLSWETVPVAVA